MRAEIKGFHSPDIFDLENHLPEKEDNFCFLLQIFIGPKGGEGEESFDIVVCTPKWFLDNFKEEEIIFGYHHLIVFKYDFHAIQRKIENYINELSGSSWDELASKIMIGRWEFQDYKAK